MLLDVHCHADPPAIYLPRPVRVGVAYERFRALAEGTARRVRRERPYGLRVVEAGKGTVLTNKVYFQHVAGVITLLLELHYRYGDPPRGRFTAAEKERITRELYEQIDQALMTFSALVEELLVAKASVQR